MGAAAFVKSEPTPVGGLPGGGELTTPASSDVDGVFAKSEAPLPKTEETAAADGAAAGLAPDPKSPGVKGEVAIGLPPVREKRGEREEPRDDRGADRDLEGELEPVELRLRL